MKQLKYLIRELQRLKLDAILCSPAIRTTKIILEKDVYLSPLLILCAAAKEWPRATAMIGRKNTEPEVERYLEGRVKRFRPGGAVLPGEESCNQAYMRMVAMESELTLLGASIKAKTGRPARIAVISHGNSGRQFRGFCEADGDEKQFRSNFRKHYNKMGIDPATIMSPMWYGRFFRNGHIGWNVDEGSNRHLPRKLRDSVI